LQKAVSVLLALALVSTTMVFYGTVIDNRWYKIIAVEGGSMEPTFGQGDAIVLLPPPEEMVEGLIVTLLVEDQLVTHRVVRVSNGKIITQGDANDHPDGWDDPRVVGRHLFTIPLLGHLLD
jgi:signal peptidase I